MQNPVITVICTELKGKRKESTQIWKKRPRAINSLFFSFWGAFFLLPLGGPRAEGCVPRVFSLCGREV